MLALHDTSCCMAAGYNSRSALPRKRVAVIKELALVPGRIDGGAQRSTPRLANAFRAG